MMTFLAAGSRESAKVRRTSLRKVLLDGFRVTG
jgi:hypothetical protein